MAQPTPPQLQDLLAKFKVPEHLLDAKLSEENLLEISKSIDRKVLGPYLGLSPQEMSDIDLDEQTEEIRRRATLRKWKEKYGLNATYRVLINALLKCSRAEQAQNVCTLLIQEIVLDPEQDTSSTDTATMDGAVANLSGHTQDAKDMRPPQASRNTSLVELEQGIALLDEKFDDLVDKAANDLKARNVDLPSVKRSLFRLPLSKMHNQPALDDHSSAINKAESIDTLFCILQKLWDPLNPALLERVVHRFGSSDIQRKMQTFLHELRQFRMKTRLREFAQWSGFKTESEIRTTCIVIYKMGKDWENRTLEDFETLKREHAMKGYFEDYTLKIKGAKNTSMSLVWEIPFAFSPKAIFHQIPHSFFIANGVMRVTIDGISFFDSEVDVSPTKQKPCGIPFYNVQSIMENPSFISSLQGKDSKIYQSPIAKYYPADLHYKKEQELLQMLKRMKGVEGKKPTAPTGKDYVESRGIRYHMKCGCVAGNISETMILVSVGSEFPAGVAVERRVKNPAMAEKAISMHGRLPSSVTGFHDEAAADLMARASLALQSTSTDLVRLCLDTPGKQQLKRYYLQVIREFFKHCQQPQGHSEEGTGNWCFKDGTISFQEIFDLYRQTCPEKVLCIMPDCCYSGQWVIDCAKTLDSFGIPPCGHRAREQGVLIKVLASCKLDEKAAEPCFSVEGMAAEDDGTLICYTKKKVNETQTFCGTDFTNLTCCRGPDKSCRSEKILKNWTWEEAIGGGLKSRVYKVRGKDKDRPAWYFVLLFNKSEEHQEGFSEHLKKDIIHLEEWGYIIQSGYGENPPESVEDKISASMSL